MDAQIVDASSFFIPSAATVRPNEGALIELRHGGETAALSSSLTAFYRHVGVRRESSLSLATRSKLSDLLLMRYCSSPASVGSSRTISYGRPDVAVPGLEGAKSTSWPTLNL
jgi:hypothetical protein